MDLLPDRVPWYIVGPLMGLCVVALYALANHRLGVSGSYQQVALLVAGRQPKQMWQVWFFGGLVIGSLGAALLRGGPSIGLGYGVLGQVMPLALLVPTLFLGGLLIGYGARWSGGCTSGHGLGGTSSLSPASWAATATFMASAVGLSILIHFLTGGVL